MNMEIKSEIEDADSLLDNSEIPDDYSSNGIAEGDQQMLTGDDSDSCCKVCEDSATGMYFGALVCVPCKTFFLRYGGDNCSFECKFDKNCEITPTSRTQCKYCRYQKCIDAGMCRKVRPTQVQLNEGQQLCVVCNDLANGVHFGAITCEGCKKFFRRGLSEHSTYTCKSDKKCLVNPRTRNSCRYCRYEKCLSSGMSREAIQMGRPSKIRTVSTCNDGHQRIKELKNKNSKDSIGLLSVTDDWIKYYTDSGLMATKKSINDINKKSEKNKNGGLTNVISQLFLKESNSGEFEESLNSNDISKSLDSVRMIDSFHLQTGNNYKKDGNQCQENSMFSFNARESFSPRSTADQFSSSNIPGLFTGILSNSSLITSSMQLNNRALTMSSGGFCQMNSPLHKKRTCFEMMEDDISVLDGAQTSDDGLGKSDVDSNTYILKINDKTMEADQYTSSNPNSNPRQQDFARKSFDPKRSLLLKLDQNLSDTVLSSLRFELTTSDETRILNDSQSTTFDDNQHKVKNYFDSKNEMNQKSLASISFPLSESQLESTSNGKKLRNSSSSSSSLASSNKWQRPSDRDSPYYTVFTLASSCQLFNEASKNPAQKVGIDAIIDGGQVNAMNSFEEQMRKTEEYWLRPILPDENVIFSEKHLEIIYQIIRAYERFVQTGTNINERLTKELENWRTNEQEVSSTLAGWIQINVVPVYTLLSITYCKSLPGFDHFFADDQAQLIRLGQSQSRILAAGVHWFDKQQKKFNDFLSWRPLDLFKTKLLEFAEKIQSLGLDRIESAVLNVLTLIATDYPGLENTDVIEKSRQQILTAFRAYFTAKHGTPNNRLETIFQLVPECRRLGFLHFKMTQTDSLRAEEVPSN